MYFKTPVTFLCCQAVWSFCRSARTAVIFSWTSGAARCCSPTIVSPSATTSLQKKFRGFIFIKIQLNLPKRFLSRFYLRLQIIVLRLEHLGGGGVGHLLLRDKGAAETAGPGQQVTRHPHEGEIIIARKQRHFPGGGLFLKLGPGSEHAALLLFYVRGILPRVFSVQSRSVVNNHLKEKVRRRSLMDWLWEKSSS